ncbi:MAG: helix-turn-helix domain-containing protein [Bacteroides sp.]|nr:helix-turn-helix domain-containing protein [Bacteroides sp.]
MLSGDRLKFLRYMHNVTQKQVADFCNVSVRYINMVENGEENLSKETYHAFLNCIYGIGKPLPKTPRYNTKKAREEKEASKE